MKKLRLGISIAAMLMVMAACGGANGPVRSLGDATLFSAAEDPEGVPKIQALIQRGDDIDAKDDQGYTPLHHAAGTDNANTVKILLLSGADPGIQDNEGRTAYDLAQQAGMQNALWAFDKYAQ